MYIIKIAVKCIIEQEGKILLMKESASSSWKPGKWSLPGGKLEAQETYQDAITREILEETGLEVSVSGLFEIEELVGIIDKNDRLAHHYIFIAKQTGGTLKHADQHVAKLKWFDKRELKALTVFEMTEYYYPNLFMRYFTSNKSIDLSVINVLNGGRDPQYEKWLNS